MSRPSEPTSPSNVPPHPPLDATMREQCLQYLLGELSSPELEQFHARLATDDALNDELIQQANLVYQLTIMDPSDSTRPSLTPPSLAPPSSVFGWNRLSMMASVAACGVLAMVCWAWQSDRGHPGVPPQGLTSESALPKEMAIVAEPSSQRDDDELRIAQAWVAGPLSLALATESELDCPELSELDESFHPNEDSVLHWMMVATSSGENREG